MMRRRTYLAASTAWTLAAVWYFFAGGTWTPFVAAVAAWFYVRRYRREPIPPAKAHGGTYPRPLP